MRSYASISWRAAAVLLALSTGLKVSAQEAALDPAVAVIKELLAAHQQQPKPKVVNVIPTQIAWADVPSKGADPVAPPVAEETQPAPPAPVVPPADPIQPAAPAQPAPEPPPVPVPPAPQPDAPKVVPQDPIKTAPANTQTPSQAISEVLKDLEARQQQDLIEARKLIAEARTAIAQGELAQAMRLAMRASKLAPENAEVTELMNRIREENQKHRLATASHSRAKAHLAAGLTRGQELMNQGRYLEAKDLLDGVIKAADLFPNDANVRIYREQATQDLHQFQLALKSGQIILPEAAPDTPEEEPILVAAGAAVPANMPRLLKGAEGVVPLWYSMQKNLLAKNMTVAYKSMPIGLVLDDISEATGVKFVVDGPVAEARGTVNGTLDLRVAEIPAEKILDLACLKGGMEYVIMEKAIVITTPTKAVEYVRQLPMALRENWALGRVLFPSLNPILYADAPRQVEETDVAIAVPETVPTYLMSGQALVDDIAQLLR